MRRLLSVLAALLLGSAAGLAVAAGPAAAAACPKGSGVTTVVGSSVSCDANGGSPASGNFRDTGHTLTPVDRQPGFVCKVDGAPAAANCVNTPPDDAYWGLFWSDGTSGRWVYASQGSGSLKVPAGGWVAFVFQTGGDRVAPGMTPIGPAAVTKPKPTPTKKATAKPTSKPAAKPTSKSVPGAKATPTAAPTPSASASASPTATAATPSASPSSTAPESPAASPSDATDATDDTEPASEAVDSSDGSGSLGWVAAVLAVVLLAGMGGVLWRRRAAGGSS